MRLKRFSLAGVVFLLVIVSFVSAGFFSDSSNKLTGQVIAGLDCTKSWSGSTWTGNHNEAGISQNGAPTGDNRFFCYEGNFYECAWELDDPALATKVDVGTKISNYVCTSNWDLTCSSESQIILKLSSDTNAHGAVYNGDGIYGGVCYDQIFGETGDGNRACTGTNKIVGLSDTTNAHAEDPAGTSYTTTEICYGDLRCVARPSASGCETWESLVVSLSDTTNAHLSDSAGYGIDICCRFPVCRPRSVSWSTNDAIEGQIVNLDVTTSNCDDGELISFEVWEDDTTSPDDLIIPNPLNAIVSGGVAQGSWVAEYQDDFDPFPFGGDPEYYFKATAISTGEQKETDREDEDFLRVSEFDSQAYCQPVTLCSDYYDDGDVIAETACNNDASYCNVSEFSVESIVGDTSFCDDGDITCLCEWDTAASSCEAGWNASSGGFCGDGIVQHPNGNGEFEQCDGGIGAFTCSNFDDFTGGSLNCIGCILNTSQCSGGTTGVCGNNVIDTGEQCDGSANFGSLDCSDFGFDPGNLDCYAPLTSNECQFDITQCTGGTVGDPSEIGTCTYDEDTSDNCDDGFLTVNVTATWEWAEGKDASDDPEGLRSRCVSVPDRTLVCPAQIPLPFFGAYNFIIAFLAIGMIYWILSLGKRK